jgi:Domain of unknown function (DUF222)
MGWSAGMGRRPGDEPGPGFGPPRRGAPHTDAYLNGAAGYEGAAGRQAGAGYRAGGTARDERLAGFAAGGKWDTCGPSAGLVSVLASVSAAEWRCPDATEDEMVGLVRRWAAVESWAGAAKLGVIRELIRREDKPWLPTDQHTDVPDAWSESLTHELALALAASVGSADRAAWLAWELGTRLPGIDALLTDGTLTYGKAKAVAEAFQHLSDIDAAHAEALIIGQLAGKTYLQVLRLAATAASRVDPEGDERRRKDAEQQAARVRLWREQSGAAALAGFDLPTDEALAAHANVSARAEQYKASGAFPGAKLDQLRAMGYLDLLNGVTAETRIAQALAQAQAQAQPQAQAQAQADDAESDDAESGDSGGTATNPRDDSVGGNRRGDGAPEDDRVDTDRKGDAGPEAENSPEADTGPEDENGPEDDGGPEDDSGPGDGGGPAGDGDPGEGGPGGGSPGGGAPGGGQPAELIPAIPRTDLVIPLATLLGLGNRPGEGHRFGPLDPGLCRDLAAIAASSPATKFCVTVTDQDGIAIGHGCARVPRSTASGQPKTGVTTLAALPARIQLTISREDLRRLASEDSPASRGSPWAFTRRDGNHGPPDGYGTWTLTTAGGREFAVRMEPVPTFACDHAHESRAYQANDTLRHLVQVRDGDCTFPPCTRHARESDFEHAVPYHHGGRTCACNAGARSRRCHRVKQSPGWHVTQPQPGFHEWTTPAGRSYTQEPKRYPV